MQIRNTILAVLIVNLLFFSAVTAQTTGKSKNLLPRVGVIKDYPATGMTVGCGNSYFIFPDKKNETGEEYVFLARPSREAWMNLNGRDTRLKYLRSRKIRKNKVEIIEIDEYRFGATQISISMTNNKSEMDYFLSVVITLKKGNTIKKIKVIGYSDC